PGLPSPTINLSASPAMGPASPQKPPAAAERFRLARRPAIEVRACGGYFLPPSFLPAASFFSSPFLASAAAAGAPGAPAAAGAAPGAPGAPGAPAAGAAP